MGSSSPNCQLKPRSGIICRGRRIRIGDGPIDRHKDFLQSDQQLGLITAFIAIIHVGGDGPSHKLGKLAIDKRADRAAKVAVGC